jgi:hypothetical protein
MDDVNRNYDFKILKNAPFLLTLISILTFIIGHISAYFYFSSWGVDYFQWASLDSGVAFAISSPLKILSTIAIPILFSILLMIAADLMDQYRKFSSVLNFDDFSAEDFFAKLLVFFLVCFLIYFSANQITASSEIEEVRNRVFRPMNVELSDDKQKLRCVYLVGTLGDIRVFSYSNFSLVFVPKSNINLISYLSSYPPIEFKNTGRFSIDLNTKYSEQLKIWSQFWESECALPEGYQDFKFEPVWLGRKVRRKELLSN